MKKVTVQYLYENEIRESENEPGILFSDSKVFVTRSFSSIYTAIPTADPNVVLVNLDADATDHLQGKDPAIIIDMLMA